MKNEDKVQLKGKEIVGKRVLILGEVGSGKTAFLVRLLEELMVFLDHEEITVIDMAPKRVGEIGGKIIDYLNSINGIRYLSPEKVYTPRLTGQSREEVLRYAELNRKLMEPLFNNFIQGVTKVLVLNDFTLYLHTGKLGKILNCMKLAETFLAAGYYGSRLNEDQGAGISVREKKLTEKLATYMNQTIKMSQVH